MSASGRERQGRGPLAALTLACALMASGAVAQGLPPFDGDDDLLPEPPLTLPETMAGVVRPPERDATPGRVDRIRDVFAAVRACWRLPSDGLSGQELTVRLSFRRDGAVLGEPRITYYKAGGDDERRQVFLRSVLDALRRCTPLPFTARFGASIAGRPFAFRFVDDRPI